MKDKFDDLIFEKVKSETLNLPRSYEDKVKNTLKSIEGDGDGFVKARFSWKRTLAFGAACILCMFVFAAITYGALFHGNSKKEEKVAVTEEVTPLLESFAAPKEEKQTEEVNKEPEEFPREDVSKPKLAYDDWFYPLKNIYFVTFSIARLDDGEIYVATFAGEKGAEVFAVSDGVIEEAGFDFQRGNYVILATENGAKMSYMHLLDLQVKEGDEVQKGAVIGTLGATGRVTGPALSISVTVNGESIKPVITSEEYEKPRIFESEEE